MTTLSPIYPQSDDILGVITDIDSIGAHGAGV